MADEITQAVEPDATDEPTTDDVQDTTDDVQATTVEKIEDLPDWAQKVVKNLRSENAKYRTEKNKAEKAAADLQRKQAEEQGEYKKLYEQAQAEAETAKAAQAAAELATLKAKIGNELKLPAPLVDRLQGETEDELRQDAQSLLDALPQPQISGTDANSGIGGRKQTPQKSDDEIREMAVRLGVSFEHLKKSIEMQRN